MKAEAQSPAPEQAKAAGDHFDMIELIFFAYRDFTGDPDAILAKDGFGRAHHRVLHFVGRKPGLTVAELLAILGITKQSLARVLKELIATRHIVQAAGQEDRRQRQLYLTEAGRLLAARLAAPQSQRIAKAMAGIGAAERETVRRFLVAMLNDTNLEAFKALEALHSGKVDP
jgi:DNA-binding MarR family transcriptional regulator